MGDIDRCGRHALAQRLDLDPHLRTQLGIEVREGFVEQEDLWPTYDTPSKSHTLLLAAGELKRLACQERLQTEHLRRAGDFARNFRFRDFPVSQPERQIVEHRHVLIERIVLKYHRDVTILWRHIIDDFVSDPDSPGADVLETGDHAKRRRLATSRWTN